MASILRVDLFVSVDGWAGSDGLPGYFGYLGPELQGWITMEMATSQRLIFGRRTYELLSGLPDAAQDSSHNRMSQLDKVVFSRTLRETVWPNTRICSGDLVEEITRMKAEGEVPIRSMGSMSLARQLMDAGVVDRLRLTIFPLLAGPAGREFALAQMPSKDLELVDQRVLDGRVVVMDYRPTAMDIPRA